MDVEVVATEIVDSAIKVHRVLGPGLMESAYQKCLKHEMERRGLFVQRELELPIIYEGVNIDAGYRIDLMVEHRVIIENKVVDVLLPIHEAQLLTYLRLRDLYLGFLLNWNVTLMKHGIRRMVNGARR